MTTSIDSPAVRPVTTGRRVPLALSATGVVVAAAIVTELYAALARAVGVEFLMGTFGAPRAEIPIVGFFNIVVVVGLGGVALAVCLARWAARPRRTWRHSAWSLTALSLVPIAPIVDATLTTQLALALSHVVAAGVAIPLIASLLPVTNPER